MIQAAITPVGWTLGDRGNYVSYSSKGMVLGPSDRLTVWASDYPSTRERRGMRQK